MLHLSSVIEDIVNEFYDGRRGSPEGQRITRERIHWLCRQATGERVLDGGCSQGIASILLAREGRSVLGVDMHEVALRTARERLAEEDELVRERVEFRLGDLGALPVDDGAFDTVLLGEVLEHVIDVPRVLADVRRVLRTGGRLVVTCPYGVSRSPDHKDPVYALPLLDMLSQAGLETEHLELIEGSVYAYLGLVATAREAGAPPAELPWGRVAGVVEQRTRRLDLLLEQLQQEKREERTRATERLEAVKAAELRSREQLTEVHTQRRQELVDRHAAQIKALKEKEAQRREQLAVQLRQRATFGGLLSSAISRVRRLR